MSSGRTSTTGPGRPCIATWKARADVFRQAIGVVHFADPLGEAERPGPEHLPVVDLLERLAIALAARDLADEQDHRRRVLERGVHADCRVARARAARHEAQARPTGELALRLRHVARPALVAAGDEADAVAMLVEAVERGEEAFARDAEDGGRALRDQGLDEGVPGGAVRRGRSHGGRRGGETARIRAAASGAASRRPPAFAQGSPGCR